MSNCKGSDVWASFVKDLEILANDNTEVYMNTYFKDKEGELIGSFESSLLLLDLDDDEMSLKLCGDRDRSLQFDKEHWIILKLQEPGVEPVYRLTSKDRVISHEFSIL